MLFLDAKNKKDSQIFCSPNKNSYFWKRNLKREIINNKNLKIGTMSYLRFEKAVMTNLEESLRRELLRTNRGGAYSASTLVDCNTRKYHGLLVVPVPQIDDENHVLLSSLDCTVVQHGAEFNLGLHKYQGNNFSPKGHKYIREFDASLIPTTVYRVGGVILKRETIFQAYEDRILIRYPAFPPVPGIPFRTSVHP